MNKYILLDYLFDILENDFDTNIKKYIEEDYEEAVIEKKQKEELLEIIKKYKTKKITIVNAYCENCEYIIGFMEEGEFHKKLFREGGYITSDGEGGHFSKCPKCKKDCLVPRFENSKEMINR